MQPGRSTVLVVEDDDTFRGIACMLLRDAGYDVLSAGSYYAALDLLDQPMAIGLLLLDIHMRPGEPHGWALARMAAYKRPHMRIIYMTGYEIPPGEARTALGPILRKPFDAQSLIEEVRSTLGQRAA